jgi:hypothetical protein
LIFKAGRFQIFQQRRGEGTVAAVAVGRRGAVLGGVGHQHVVHRLDRTQTTRHGAGRDRAPDLGEERIVSAGIEHHQPKLRGRGDHQHDRSQRDRFLLDIEVGFQFGVDWDKPILAADLHPVPGKKHDRHFGVAGLRRKFE